MQQVMMVGAGSVGGFFGAHLARKHPHVSFLLRPRTLHAVKERGLTIRSTADTFTVRPAAASDPRELPRPDLIILSVKAFDLDTALNQLEPVLTDRTVLLTLQNGVDTEDRIVARFGRDCVVGGVAFIYSRIAEPGVIEHYKRGAVAIGEMPGSATRGTPAERVPGVTSADAGEMVSRPGPQSDRVLQIAGLFTQAGISCQIVEDVRRSKWEKMCWNCVFNPLTVIINDRVAKALDHQEMLPVIHQIVGEVAAVAAGVKVPLAEDMPEKVVRWTQEIRDIHTSMYDDWKAGRPTEIDYLNGHVSRLGRELGIPTPLNDLLTAAIKAITEREKSGPGRLRIDGAVIQPVTLDHAALAQLPAEYQVPDVSARVPGMKGRGVTVKGLLTIPALAIGADHVTFHSCDSRFAASLKLSQAESHGILIYELDGAPLPEQKGGPFRLVTPGLGDLCAHVKGVARIEVTEGPGKDTRPSRLGATEAP